MYESIFNQREQYFISKVMMPFADTFKSDTKDFGILKSLLAQVVAGPAPDGAAKKMIEGIAFKLAMLEADAEIEKMLTDPNYGQDHVPNTKAASLAKVNNITEKHEKILSALKTYPDLSRRELASLLEQPINRVTPRCKELLEMGKIVVSGTKHDELTDRQVQTLAVVEGI